MNESQQRQAELQDLEKEILSATAEYDDLTRLNDILESENRYKDEMIEKKRALYNKTKEKNKAKLEQIEFEEMCYKDECEHELLSETKLLNDLRAEMLKLENLEVNSQSLKRSINDTFQKFQSNSLNHAIVMHDINKNIRNYREEMESALRKELSRIDGLYQRKAFDSISSDDKNILLKFSMLQDEISLQELGKSNLNIRLKRQERSFQSCIEEIKKLNVTSKKVREKLAILSMQMAQLNRLVTNIAEEDEKVETHKIKLKQELKIVQSEVESLKLLNHDLIERDIISINFETKSAVMQRFDELHNVMKYNDNYVREGLQKLQESFDETNNPLSLLIERLTAFPELCQFLTSVVYNELTKNNLVEDLYSQNQMNGNPLIQFHSNIDSGLIWLMLELSQIWISCHDSFQSQLEYCKILTDNRKAVENFLSQHRHCSQEDEVVIMSRLSLHQLESDLENILSNNAIVKYSIEKRLTEARVKSRESFHLPSISQSRKRDEVSIKSALDQDDSTVDSSQEYFDDASQPIRDNTKYSWLNRASKLPFQLEISKPMKFRTSSTCSGDFGPPLM